MGIQIRRDKFVFESGARELDGTKIEPEAQTVKHVFEGSAPIGHGVGTDAIVEGAPGVGSIPLIIEGVNTAKEVARSVSALCANCKYFDRAGWLAMIARSEGPGSTAEERHGIMQIRGELLVNMPDSDNHMGADGDYDVEHALKSMGMCHALREFYKGRDGEDPGIIGVWPTAGCPADTCSPDKPQGIFVPKDGDAKRASQQNYDAVMLRAAGKILTNT